jgi:gluconokinase
MSRLDVAPGRAAMPVVVSLDVGTTSARAELYDALGRRVRGSTCQVGLDLGTTTDGGATMDFDALFERVCEVIDGVVSFASSCSLSPAAVGMSTFWHSIVGTHGDVALTPIYLWADSRSRDQMEWLRARLDAGQVHARTGCVLHWSYLPAKLRWAHETEPSVATKVSSWLSPGEHIHRRLFGSSLCSVSMASGTGLLDQHTRTWDSEVLATIGIDPGQLGTLGDIDTPSRGLRPAFAARWPVLRDVPWIPALGDGACSNVGASCLTRERIALMVGTSGAMRVAWRSPDVTIPEGAWCYRIDAHRFVMGGALTNGGNLFAWMGETLRLPNGRDLERAIAAADVDDHGLTVIPFLAGERAPGYAPHARAAILGLTLASRPVDIARAGLEAIALRFALLYQIISTEVSEARELIATGGALLRSPAWTRMMADAIGRPIRPCLEPEGSSRGAALIALESIGAIPDAGAVPVRLGPPIEPDPRRHERFMAAQVRHCEYYRLLVKP